MKKTVQGIKLILDELNIEKGDFYQELSDIEQTLENEFNVEEIQNAVNSFGSITVFGDEYAGNGTLSDALSDEFDNELFGKINETNHLDLFFEMDWTRGAGQLESYGHDIECSWLLHEAALVLGDEEVLNKVEPIVQLVAVASEKGLRPDGSMIHEANLDTGRVDDDLHWWVQAENVVGWYNIYQYFGDEDALDKALRGWAYIKAQLIDYEHGEWYWSRHADGTLNTVDDKAGFWKCPYHNSRMCLEIIERTDNA